MIRKNLRFSLLLMFLSYASTILVMPAKDELGRTPLMNYVIKQEDIFKNLHVKLQEVQDSQELNQIQKQEMEALITTDFNTWFKETSATILQMIEKDGVEQLSEKDNDGNTVINFTTSTSLYKFLREQGAPFQFFRWWQFNYKNIPSIDFFNSAVLIAASGTILSSFIAPHHQSMFQTMKMISGFGLLGSWAYELYTKP